MILIVIAIDFGSCFGCFNGYIGDSSYTSMITTIIIEITPLLTCEITGIWTKITHVTIKLKKKATTQISTKIIDITCITNRESISKSSLSNFYVTFQSMSHNNHWMQLTMHNSFIHFDHAINNAKFFHILRPTKLCIIPSKCMKWRDILSNTSNNKNCNIPSIV